MSATTVTLSLPQEQLDLLEDVQHLLKQYSDHLNHSVWLKEPEAAERLKVSLSTIRAWRKEGWLRYVGVGENIRYRAEYLDADFEAKGLVKASLAPLMRDVIRKPPARRLAS
jgi:excisionase family DNA binding protein